MTEIDRRIRETRKRLRMTQGEFATALGVTQSTVSRWESGAQSPEFSIIMKLADLAGIDPIKFGYEDDDHVFEHVGTLKDITVVGGIAQEKWVDEPLFDRYQQFNTDIPFVKEWRDFDIEGFVLQDDSGEYRYRRDSIVFIAKNDDIELRHEDVVVIVRQDDRGLYEVTLKELFINSRGEVYAVSLNPDPEHYQAFKIVSPSKDTTFETVVKLPPDCVRGLVIASFSIENPSRLRAKK